MPPIARRLVACLMLCVCLWTLTLAPAFAAYFAFMSPAATSSTTETAACRCLVCAGKKMGACCCAGKTSSGGADCALRARCDNATRAVNLPVTWWVALLPAAATLPAPLPAFVAIAPFPAFASPLAGIPAAPDIPPRSLS